MFISDNTIPFFGRKIKVLNFHTKKYLNPKARRRYRKNYKILSQGKLIKEFGEWLSNHETWHNRFVILGNFLQKDIDKLIEFTNHYIDLSFYVYSTKSHYNISSKQDNLRVIFLNTWKVGNRYYDQTAFVREKPEFRMVCPKFKINRPCDGCMKCIHFDVVVPEKVLKYLF